MSGVLCVLLAVLSIWDYPSRQMRHARLAQQFREAIREGDTKTMVETCRKGVKLLPDDPTWHYNLACSLAYFKNPAPALDELEKAIDLGFRDVKMIAADTDLKRLSKERRYAELIEYAKEMVSRPILSGPMMHVPATGFIGESISLGAHNLGWDFDAGCFVANISLAPARKPGPYAGLLYMNRDAGHSVLPVANYPGITSVRLDAEGRERKADLDFPNMLFPMPIFGNCSRAQTLGPFWRSMPRALMTTESKRMSMMVRFYLSNQIWAFPVNADTPPVGKHGDVFASVTPYWFQMAGASWSDRPILDVAIQATAAFKPAVKDEIIRRGLLAPTLQALVRQSFKCVSNETDYLSFKAHPTSIPPGLVDVTRLKRAAAEMSKEDIPPLAPLQVRMGKVVDQSAWPEPTYGSPFACAFVLRSRDPIRSFDIGVRGKDDYAFAIVHDTLGAAKLERKAANMSALTLDRSRMTPTNRVDVAVFARRAGTRWGAPSYVSFSVVDPKAPYSDPALTPLEQPTAEEPKVEKKSRGVKK